MNWKNKLCYSFIAMGLMLFIGLNSCAPSKNDSKQVPPEPVQQQNQIQDNNVNTKAASPATNENTGQTQNDNNNGVMLNPPHGQPGHRCEIPVGAPLSTPAANTIQQPATVAPAATAPTISNNSMSPTIENANRINPSQRPSTAAPETGPKPANNPPHGQPWHRCDIAVGSPLP